MEEVYELKDPNKGSNFYVNTKTGKCSNELNGGSMMYLYIWRYAHDFTRIPKSSDQEEWWQLLDPKNESVRLFYGKMSNGI